MRPSLLVATMTLVAGTLALAQAQDEAPSPFVAPSDAMAESPVLNPFASPATTADNPFVAPGDQADPFASAPVVNLPATAPAAATGAAPADDPFGSTSPFVNLGPGNTPPPAAPTAPAAPSNDPFSTTTSTDPFAAPATAGAAADPFSTTTATAPATGTEGSAAASETPTNPDGIAEAALTEFRYDRVMVWDGREVVARRAMTRAEAQTFDQERKDQIRADMAANRLPGYNAQTTATAAPDAWVEWAYYYQQLDMWAEYTERVGLGGKSAAGPLMDDITWPGVQTAGGTTEGVGGLAVGGGLPVGGGLGGLSPAGGPGLAGGGLLDPLTGGGLVGGVGGNVAGQSVTERVVTQIIGMYERAQDELTELEVDQQTFMEDMVAGIQTRADRRDAYREWREARQQAVEDFLNNDWRRRYEGEVAMVGGVRYELYRPGTQPSSVPRNVRVVVTDTMRLTPFDLIDEKTGLVLEPPSE